MNYLGEVVMHPIADNLTSIFSMIALILFIIWMIFFDSNSLIIHNELNNDINESDRFILKDLDSLEVWKDYI